MINIFFLVVYLFFGDTLQGEELFYVLTTHCIINIIAHFNLKDNKVSPLFLFYVGVIAINYANLGLIDQYHSGHAKISYLIPKYINESAQIWCLSCVAVMMGYNFNSKRSVPPISVDVTSANTLRIIYLFLIIVNTMRLYGSGLSFLSGPILKIYALTNSIGIIFFARIWAKNDNKVYRFYALSLFILETYLAIQISFLRFDIILPTICLFAGYFIGKGSARYLLSYRIIPFLVIISLYSSIFKTLQSNRSKFYKVVATLLEDDPTKPKTNNEKENSGALLARSSNLGQLTNCVKLTKTNGFYNGKASEPLIAALVPRILWPDKPIIQLGRWFAYEMSGLSKNDPNGIGANNSINMTIPGELYLDFGIIGVLLGSFLLGAFLPLMWNSANFYTSEFNLSGTIFGGYLLLLSTADFGSDLQVVITIMSIYVSLFVIKRFGTSKK